MSVYHSCTGQIPIELKNNEPWCNEETVHGSLSFLFTTMIEKKKQKNYLVIDHFVTVTCIIMLRNNFNTEKIVYIF